MSHPISHTDVWNNCLRFIGQVVEPTQYNIWFKPIVPVSYAEGTLTVEVPSDFFRQYLEEAFLDIIKKALKKEIGADARLLYRVRPVQGAKAMTYPASHGNVPVNGPVSVGTCHPAGNPGPFVFPGIQRVQIDPRLNPAYCFANMVVGACNKMGVTAGQSIADKPGKTSFNPLFLFGGPGLGKTHLAQAIGIAVKERYPELTVRYVTGNEFKTQYMDATKNNTLVDFMAFYQKIDVLIMDDIHELMGKGSQNAFFNVFNHLHDYGKQLVFTSDRPPVELQDFEERLLSRFKWGLSVELTRPDYATRLAMLSSRSLREGVDISDEVLDYLAGHIKTSFRELEGVLISLIANATLLHREITVDLAAEVAGKLVGEEQSDLTIDRIIKVVCDYFNITRDAILSKTRKRQIVQARQIAMYECRALIQGCSLSTIGAELGGKDHATVLHACGTVQDLMDTDRTFRQYVADIENMLVIPVER